MARGRGIDISRPLPLTFILWRTLRYDTSGCMNVCILEDSCLGIALASFSLILVAEVEPGKVCSIRCQAGCFNDRSPE